MRFYHTCVLVCLAAAGCGGVVPAASAEESAAASVAGAKGAPVFTDVDEYVVSRGDGPFLQWLDLRRTLDQNFDDVCGDTFCEGDYTNLQPLRFRCSVSSTNGVLKSCTYVFAGSYEEITPETGSIRTHAKTFSCRVPVSGISFDSFVSAMTAPGETPPLRRLLPGATRSIYDSLVGCL
jgi:hypothetical protein